MSKSKTNTVQRISDRPGEGVPVAYTREHSMDVSGSTGISVLVDMSSAPVPERRYVADIVSVVRVDDAVQLLFGQRKVGSQDLRSLVVIHMTGSGVHQLLGSAPAMRATMSAFAERNRLPSANLMNIKEEPSQSVTLAANIVVASISNRDGCMDFYYSSPYVAVQVSRGGKFSVDPIARVMLPMNLLRAILDKLDSIKDDLPRDIAEEAK